MKKIDNLAEILSFAISLERASYDFDIELSRRANTEAMKSVFLDFAEQERTHKERLLRILGIAENVILDSAHHQEIAINKEHAAMMLHQILARLTDRRELREVLELPAVEESYHKRRFEKKYHDIMTNKN